MKVISFATFAVSKVSTLITEKLFAVKLTNPDKYKVPENAGPAAPGLPGKM